MNVHKNARSTPYSRRELVHRVLEGMETPKAATAAFGVFMQAAAKWVARFQAESIAGLQDRAPRPHKLHYPLSEYVLRQIEAPRRQRWTDQWNAISASAVNRTLHCPRFNRIQGIDSLLPARCYGFSQLSKMLHDDRSHIAFYVVMLDQTARNAIIFLQAAVAYYQNFEARIKQAMTENRASYTSRIFSSLCTDFGILHVCTHLYTLRINEKTTRFIQTALRGWTYENGCQSSVQRHKRFPAWIHLHNWHQLHHSLENVTFHQSVRHPQEQPAGSP